MSWFDLAMDLRPWFLVWITAVFVAIVIWALAPRRRARLDEAARIPLRDER
jgi:cbb3-type cytochrome oxidase subunit 3